MIGVSMPLFSRRMLSLGPERDLFTIVKAFALGVILATGYMHMLPDSFDDLMSDCLPENPWRKFPFTAFVAMLSAIVMLMVDSFAMSVYRKHHAKALMAGDGTDVARLENGDVQIESTMDMNITVLELGIIVHSVVIGLAMGASENPSTTPLGIVLGIRLSKVYSETSPTSLIVVGLLNPSSAGLLNYTALVDLLAADFLGPKLQTNMKLQIWSYVAVWLGAGFMSLMAKWA
ncbi:hypothetical protein Goklo_000165 [Gossypium klotzschianum]|uniref:Uncharacterized protein n=1 Tax=Gossypium klotzschianum TaxID=34286 RepID=A0A7J8VWM1_9ROSI|nr:hypothetical protein [Gossypium klotzschianum]